MLQRSANAPAVTSAAPATATPRERRAPNPTSKPPAAVKPFAAFPSFPATPDWYGSPSEPSRFSIVCVNTSSAAAPPTVSRRTGAASGTGASINAAAPAEAAAPDANTNGSSRRASCHTGTAVFAASAAVYVESGSPSSAAAGRATRAAPGSRPVHACTAATDVVSPQAVSTQDPTLIGE